MRPLMRSALASACMLVAVSLGGRAVADQVIYVKVSDFNPAKSKFDQDVGGNRWVETEEPGALFGTAYGGPGGNIPANGGPYLTIQLPEDVKSGEATSDGKDWVAWGRLYEPESLNSGNLANSMFLRMGPDGSDWTPDQRGSTALLWNDVDGADNALLFPDAIDGIDAVFTDEGDSLPWFWENHRATVNGPRAPDSTMNPPLEVGENWCELSVRESGIDNYPRIELISFRNDGAQPSDTEAVEYFDRILAVKPGGKLARSWPALRR